MLGWFSWNKKIVKYKKETHIDRDDKNNLNRFFFILLVEHFVKRILLKNDNNNNDTTYKTKLQANYK
jgi:hypothetical protein